MLPKLALHLQPERGWINDPNGLCYFQGKYHAFFQHNPKAPVWDTMHWGHARQRGPAPLGGAAHRPVPRPAL